MTANDTRGQPVTLRVGGVPEHFNIPWALAEERGWFAEEGVEVKFDEYPKGTGSMCAALRGGELDVAIALTEGLVADIVRGGPGYRIAGAYVSSPLNWGIVKRSGSAAEGGLASLANATFGVSRLGSGSHIMTYLLAKNNGWKVASSSGEGAGVSFKVLGGITDLVDGVVSGKSDAFLWEYFMLKPRVDAGELSFVGSIPTPWPCFMFAVREEVYEQHATAVHGMIRGVLRAAETFVENAADSIPRISAKCLLTSDDAAAWMKTVRYPKDSRVSSEMIGEVVLTLKEVGVLSADAEGTSDSIVFADALQS